MMHELRPKYSTPNHSFSIQYAHRSAYISMPHPHVHEHYEIFYLMSGQRVYFINDTIYTPEKGDIVIVNPHDLHRTTSADAHQYERYLVSFTQQFAWSALASVKTPFLPLTQASRVLRIPLKEQVAIERLLREMETECQAAQKDYEAYLQTLLAQLLIRIARLEQASPAGPSTHPMHDKVSEIAAYVNAHYAESLTLERIAEQFYVSSSYLSRIFHRLTGFRFHEYIQLVRIRQAQLLLRETSGKIQHIAERTGFTYITSFNKTFKKITGMSPMRYRQLYQARESGDDGHVENNERFPSE